MTMMLRNDDMLSDAEIQEARVDLAASFRWFARLGMHEAVANHLSVAVSKDGSKFLMNMFASLCCPQALRMKLATRSAIIMVGALVLPLTIAGMTDASPIHSLSTP